jgi:hypothetical protein
VLVSEKGLDMTLNRKNIWFSALALVTIGATAVPASAETICATARKTTWNVPNGGLVLSRSKGFIATILDEVNEWGTHSVLSNGTDFWVTHSTARQPMVQNSCSIPLRRSDFDNALPGAQQISLPSAYVFYFGDQTWTTPQGTRVTGSLNSLRGITGMEWYSGNNPNGDWGYYEGRSNPWQWFPGNSDRGGKVANHFWAWTPFASIATSGNPVNYFYQIQEPIGGVAKPIRYGFNQYLNMQNVHKGDLTNNVANGREGAGAVCSTLLAFGSWRAGQGGVSPRDSYTQDEKARAINALWNKVHSDCKNKGKDDFGINWSDVACTISNYDVCERAADQVVNAFTRDDARPSEAWMAVRDNPSVLPRTISPDCLAGRNSKCYATGGGSSPWGWDVPKTVQWSGSTAYSCWTN